MANSIDRRCVACNKIVIDPVIQECPVCYGTLVCMGYDGIYEPPSKPKSHPKKLKE